MTTLQRQRASEANQTHGLSRTPLHRVWGTMHSRCRNPRVRSFKDYGAKGITVCDAWADFQTFADWATAAGWTKGLEIDLIDNAKGYSPENCRITTRLENARNRQNIRQLTMNGETLPLWRWAEVLGLRPDTIHQRLHRGDDDDRALRPRKTP